MTKPDVTHRPDPRRSSWRPAPGPLRRSIRRSGELCRTPLIAVTLLGIAACDFPTEPPIIEQSWTVPLEETWMAVSELLPPGVTVTGGAFDISVDPLTEGESLGQLCPDCIDGFTGPVPAFSGSFTGTQGLPTDVEGASVDEVSLEIRITNGLSFDPLAGGGTLTVRIRDGATGIEVGSLVVDGQDGSLAPGSTLERDVDLQDFDVGDELELSAEVDSPGGQMATIDLDDEVSVTVNTVSLLVASVTVDVTGRSVSFQKMELDLENVDQSIADRIDQGSLSFQIANPFSVSVDGTVEIGATSKSFAVPVDPASTVQLVYSGDDLRTIIGDSEATFSGSGIANGGTITLTPDQELVIDPTLDVTLTIG